MDCSAQKVTLNSTSGSSAERLEALRRAVRVVRLQEERDALWEERRGDQEAPAWRPHGCLSTHDALLRSTVESRLKVRTDWYTARVSQSGCRGTLG